MPLSSSSPRTNDDAFASAASTANQRATIKRICEHQVLCEASTIPARCKALRDACQPNDHPNAARTNAECHSKRKQDRQATKARYEFGGIDDALGCHVIVVSRQRRLANEERLRFLCTMPRYRLHHTLISETNEEETRDNTEREGQYVEKEALLGIERASRCAVTRSSNDLQRRVTTMPNNQGHNDAPKGEPTSRRLAQSPCRRLDRLDLSARIMHHNSSLGRSLDVNRCCAHSPPRPPVVHLSLL